MGKPVNWDRFGIITSFLCAIHCVVLPIVLTSLPVFGINIIHNAFFEWGMITLAFGVGFYALWHGYKTHHLNIISPILFTAGFVLLVTKQFLPDAEIFFLVPAVICIISAHCINILSWKQSRKPAI